jgi:hypothetical protein
MSTTATHNEHDTTTERVLFMAFELREKSGSSDSPRDMVKSRVSALSQRVSRRACSKKSPRPKAAWVCLKPHR